MQSREFKGLRDDIGFMTDMLIMTCASIRITFGQGIGALEDRLERADDDVREATRNILRQAVQSQIELFQELFERVDKSTGGRLS